jgi:hypothetical protein
MKQRLTLCLAYYFTRNKVRRIPLKNFGDFTTTIFITIPPSLLSFDTIPPHADQSYSCYKDENSHWKHPSQNDTHPENDDAGTSCFPISNGYLIPFHALNKTLFLSLYVSTAKRCKVPLDFGNVKDCISYFVWFGKNNKAEILKNKISALLNQFSF